MTRIWLAALGGAAGLALALTASAAAPPGADPNLWQEVAHKHHHLNGHNLLGAGLKKDGKHTLGKLGGHDVTADVKGGKVTGMAAGDLPVKHVKSNKKMAFWEGGVMPAAWTPTLQLAQYDTTYYAYCFDDGVDYTCYWYPESDVDTSAYSWDPYDPMY